MILGLAGCLKYTGLYVVAAVDAVVAHPPAREPRPRGHGRLRAGVIVFDQIVLLAWWGHSYLSQTQLQLQRVLGIQSSGWYSNVPWCADSPPIPAVSRLHPQFPDSTRGDGYRCPLHVQVLPAARLGTRAASSGIVQLGGYGDSDLRPVQSAFPAVFRACARALVSSRLD